MIRRKTIAMVCACNFLLGIGLFVAQSLWLPDLSSVGWRVQENIVELSEKPFPRLAPQLFQLPATRPENETFYKIRREVTLNSMNADWEVRSKFLISAFRAGRRAARRAEWFFYIALSVVVFNAVGSLLLLVMLKENELRSKQEFQAPPDPPV